MNVHSGLAGGDLHLVLPLNQPVMGKEGAKRTNKPHLGPFFQCHEIEISSVLEQNRVA